MRGTGSSITARNTNQRGAPAREDDLIVRLKQTARVRGSADSPSEAFLQALPLANRQNPRRSYALSDEAASVRPDHD